MHTLLKINNFQNIFQFSHNLWLEAQINKPHFGDFPKIRLKFT